MTEGEKIIYAAVAGFAIWIIQKSIAFFIHRSRVAEGLLTEVKLNLKEIKEAKGYLKKFEQQELLEGKRLGYLDRFVKTESSFYKSQIQELPKYFNGRELDKITKFFNSFWELQMIIDGFMAYLYHLSDCNAALTNVEITRAKKKLNRMYKLMDVILENNINKIADLIDDYDGRMSSESML